VGGSTARSTLKLPCSATLSRVARHVQAGRRGRAFPDADDDTVRSNGAGDCSSCRMQCDLSTLAPQSFPIQSDLQSSLLCSIGCPRPWTGQWQQSAFAGTNCLQSGCRTGLALLLQKTLDSRPCQSATEEALQESKMPLRLCFGCCLVDGGCQWGPVGEPVPIVQCHGIISPGIPFWSVSIVFLGAAMLVTGKLPRSPPLCVLINRISSGTRRGLNSSL
jgi:hypothetical protein